MFKVLLAGLLFSQSLWAGFPPTSTKGQSDSSKSITFDFQAPNKQLTKTSSTAALIETGNNNALYNPGFEATTYSLGWTASGGASAVGNTTNAGTGLNSYSWDASATSQTLTSDAVTIPAGWYGRNGEASCSFKTAATDYSLQAYDGTNIIATQTIVASTYFSPQVLYFPMPTSGTIALRLISASNAAIVYLDDCYLGVARSIVDNVLTSQAPTVTKYVAAGSVTYTPPVGAKWLRVILIGSGGGGGGGGTAGSPTDGGNGGDSVFGGSTAGGGVKGIKAATNTGLNAGGNGGTATLGTGHVGLALPGNSGGRGLGASGLAFYPVGPNGGSAPCGGGGFFPGTNTGGGGGGGTGNTSQASGSGGGSGACLDFVVANPVAVTVTVGAAGTAGTAGTTSDPGIAGALGSATIFEFYQ